MTKFCTYIKMCSVLIPEKQVILHRLTEPITDQILMNGFTNWMHTGWTEWRSNWGLASKHDQPSGQQRWTTAQRQHNSAHRQHNESTTIEPPEQQVFRSVIRQNESRMLSIFQLLVINCWFCLACEWFAWLCFVVHWSSLVGVSTQRLIDKRF